MFLGGTTEIEQRTAYQTMALSTHNNNDVSQEVPVESTSTTNGEWKTTIRGYMTPLGSTFSPGPYDVVCSCRTKKNKNHPGNRYFQHILEETFAEKYANARGKLAKSLIVSEIIDTVRRRTPHGGFVRESINNNNKVDEDAGSMWYEVGDAAAREKVSQSLRDILYGRYKSSASSKKRRRSESNAKLVDDIETLVASDEYVSTRIRRLSHTIEDQGSQISDISLTVMMTQANTDILRRLSKAENDGTTEEKEKEKKTNGGGEGGLQELSEEQKL